MKATSKLTGQKLKLHIGHDKMTRIETEVMIFILRTRLTEVHNKVVVVTRKIEGAGAREEVAEAGEEAASNTSLKASLKVSSKSNQSTNRS